jgi:hypothetical protein
VAVVRVVEVAGHEVIDVIAVGDRLVSAAGAVSVPLGVSTARVRGRARRRVRDVHANGAFVDVSVVGPVQVPVVRVVGVPFVLDRDVSAARAVGMGVLRVNAVLAHRLASAPCS